MKRGFFMTNTNNIIINHHSNVNPFTSFIVSKSKAKQNDAISAFDVAAYIVNKCFEQGIHIKNHQLQNLLFLVQSYSLGKYGRPCFLEKLQAKKIGAIVPEVYEVYRRYGSMAISPINQTNYIFCGANSFPINIPKEKADVICRVVDSYGFLSSKSIENIVKNHKSWAQAYAKAYNSQNFSIYGLPYSTDEKKRDTNHARQVSSDISIASMMEDFMQNN